MKTIRQIGSLAFVLGLFTAIFAGIPWAVVAGIPQSDPQVPIWLRIAIFCLLGGILIVLATVAIEQRNVVAGASRPRETTDQSRQDAGGTESTPGAAKLDGSILLLNSDEVPGRKASEVLGLVQGHTVYAIWLGNDLSAIVRLILGGELTEYTDMMGKARTTATNRMITQAKEMNADAIINVRYMTTSVIGSAAELLAYGTAVKLG